MPFSTNPNAPVEARLPVGFALNYAIFAAPLAWMVQLVVGYALASHACYPHRIPLVAPVWSGLWGVLIAVDFIAVIIAGLAVAAAYAQWIAWRGADLRHIGQRRNRYLARWAMLTSALFTIAVIFTIVMLFIEPVCKY
jgi:hypothetical protein